MAKSDAAVLEQSEKDGMPAIKSITKLSPAQIHANPDMNFSRFGAEDIAGAQKTKDLAFRMSTEGNRDPVEVTDTPKIGLDLVCGFRRHAAGMLLINGFDYTFPEGHDRAGETIHVHVPAFKLQVVKVPRMNLTDRLARNVGENADREPLTAMDYYHICHRCKHVEGLKTGEIAKIICKDASYVSQYLKLGQLPRKIQNALASGEINPSIRVLMKITELPPGEEQDSLFDAIMDGERVTLENVRSVIHTMSTDDAPETDESEDDNDGDGETDDETGDDEGKATSSKKRSKRGVGDAPKMQMTPKLMRKTFETLVGPAEFEPTATFVEWILDVFLKGEGGSPEKPQKLVNALDRFATGVVRATIDHITRNDINIAGLDKDAVTKLAKSVINDPSLAKGGGKGSDKDAA